jgi:hypothetical protein
MGHGGTRTLQHVMDRPFHQGRPRFHYREKIQRILKYSYLVVSLSAPTSLVRLTMVAVGCPIYIRDQILHGLPGLI